MIAYTKSEVLHISSSIEECVHRWGSAISEIIIDKPCYYFRVPHLDGFIGYYLKSKCAVVFGDPICPPEHKEQLALAFSRFIEENKWSAIYMLASDSFARWAIQHTCKVLIEVGEELVFDPQCNPLKQKKSNKLRNKFHQATQKGLKVDEYIVFDEHFENSINEMAKEWTNGRGKRQIFMSDLDFFSHRAGRRWFYLQDGDSIIGMAMLTQLESYDGWLLKFLIIRPNAPNGASEFLMLSVLEQLRQENCHFLTYATVPLNHVGEIVGLNSVSSSFVRVCYWLGKKLFHWDQKKTYWQKFYPQAQPTYLLASKSFGLKECYALMQMLEIEI